MSVSSFRSAKWTRRPAAKGRPPFSATVYHTAGKNGTEPFLPAGRTARAHERPGNWRAGFHAKKRGMARKQKLNRRAIDAPAGGMVRYIRSQERNEMVTGMSIR